jgi:uracil-DNA glycosylase family 4
MTARKRDGDARGLVMPQGRSIPRQPPSRPRRPDPPADDAIVDPAITKSAGELVALAAQIRACEACRRAAPERAYGTGYVRAPILLVKEQPSVADVETGGAFADESEPLTKAFEALGIPLSWVYGSTAVRCGTAAASTDEVHACSGHLLVEIESVGPRVVVAFGERAVEAVRALDGRCGIAVPEEVGRGRPVRIRPDLELIATESLPDGVTSKDAKRRLWRDLRALPAVLGPAVLET